MSDHASAAVHPPAESFLTRHHFLLRRLHSLSGIVPIGLFVIVHLFTNSQIFFSANGPGGADHFQHEVDFIHSMPALLWVEIALWSAIAFHAALGVVYMVVGTESPVKNVANYPYWSARRYMLQRLTAWIALIFIFIHVATLRWRWDIFGWFTPFYWRGEDVPGLDHKLAEVPLTTPLTAYALQKSWLIVAFYLVGVSAAIYHWCNGLWTAAISWGLTITKTAQKRWGQVCIGLGAALTVFMLVALVGTLKYDLNKDTTEAQKEVLKFVLPGWNSK